MPYADPKKRAEASRKWRQRKIAEGYGKALYARRAARYRNEEILRAAVEYAVLTIEGGGPTEDRLRLIRVSLLDALESAPPISKPIKYMPKENHEQKAPEAS